MRERPGAKRLSSAETQPQMKKKMKAQACPALAGRVEPEAKQPKKRKRRNPR